MVDQMELKQEEAWVAASLHQNRTQKNRTRKTKLTKRRRGRTATNFMEPRMPVHKRTADTTKTIGNARPQKARLRKNLSSLWKVDFVQILSAIAFVKKQPILFFCVWFYFFFFRMSRLTLCFLSFINIGIVELAIYNLACLSFKRLQVFERYSCA